MKTSIYSRHRFHPDIIRRAIWMYFRFNLSFRDVEELMIERGVDVSYETIRRWIDKFGSTYAKRMKSRSESPSPVWHLDEVHTKINGKMIYLWRAVDDEGTVLDVVVHAEEIQKRPRVYCVNCSETITLNPLVSLRIDLLLMKRLLNR